MYSSIEFMGYVNYVGDLKESSNGTKYISIAVGIPRNVRDKNGKSENDSIFVTFFNDQAERLSETFSKGNIIFVSGRLQSHQESSDDPTTHKVIGNYFTGPLTYESSEGGNKDNGSNNRGKKGGKNTSLSKGAIEWDDDEDIDEIPQSKSNRNSRSGRNRKRD